MIKKIRPIIFLFSTLFGSDTLNQAITTYKANPELIPIVTGLAGGSLAAAIQQYCSRTYGFRTYASQNLQIDVGLNIILSGPFFTFLASCLIDESLFSSRTEPISLIHVIAIPIYFISWMAAHDAISFVMKKYHHWSNPDKS
jgi:hypothetical protein